MFLNKKEAVVFDGVSAGQTGTTEMASLANLASNGTDASAEPRMLSLALQGGGSFGAFTWGFLDRLLEEENIVLDVVSGASAGALNAVLLADGLAGGGKEGAREKLGAFWHQVGNGIPHLPAGPGHPLGAAVAFELTTHLASPYQLNPLGINPLRHLLTHHVDFARLREQTPVRLRLATTRVKDGTLRLFSEDEVTVDVVLASACLPFLHHAVEIEGEAYWDGGYSANPPLRQLVIDTHAEDVILVQLLPDEHDGVPHSSRDISRRLQEISFTTSLRKELEALHDLRDICKSPGNLSSMCQKIEDMRLHRVKAFDFVENLQNESALDTRWSLLRRLKESGREAADIWLLANPGAGRKPATITSS